MEEEIRTINLNLQKKVEEELAKNRIKDQLMFEQSRNISMGELLMNISHHWRQPLCSIGLSIQDIKDAYLHSELNEKYLSASVGYAMSELKKLSETIDNFRSFYTQDKRFVEFNIAEEINKAEMLISGYITGNGIIIEKDLDPQLTAQGYSNEFAHVIFNVLTNSKDTFERRAISEGIIKIKLYKDDTTHRIIITIMDNGGGIDRDLIDKIFGPSFTAKDMEKGNGMGLFMAKITIEEGMNGSLSVRNIDGGYEFRIEL
ncbi:MAG: HAMP domain-containing histidine kinase [Nitrospirae bacterium]|nr:HAMP domain-containing histidine kinase [Nitrospirota bacterium]